MSWTDLAPEQRAVLVSNALDFADSRRKASIEELVAFLRIPSVGTQPQHDVDTQAAAHWLADRMAEAGLENARVIPTEGQPLVYADWLHAGEGAPTVLVYGHYDVQPAEPLDLWHTPPFEPTRQGDYLYARGAADDKGQLYVHVKCAQAYLATAGKLPVNVKYIVEGEEETGGRNLAVFVPRNVDMLQADSGLVSDSHILSPTQPALVYGVRGMCYVFLDVTGPDHDLHSGSYGGAIDNPLNVLSHIIAKLKDEEGRILIPGFYDDVRPLTPVERTLLNDNPLDASRWLKQSGAPQVWGEPGYTLLERLGARPTLDVNGIVGGYTGPGAKTVLPASAHAKISMRLVPDQEPINIFERFRDYVQAIAPPTVEVAATFVHGAPASVLNVETPAIQAASLAYEQVFGRRPVFLREGGSLPVVGLLQKHLGIQTVLMGFGLPDDRIHSPNERFYLPNFYRGIEAAIRYLDIYANLTDQGSEADIKMP